MEKYVAPMPPRIEKVVLFEAGKAICDKIRTAEVSYRDAQGDLMFTQIVGDVNPGDTIVAKVPIPEDFII